jgi:plastocyanin
MRYFPFLRSVAALLSLSLAGGLAAAASLSVQVNDASGKPLADAIVYATAGAGGSASAGTRAEVAQEEREFVPRISVVQTGTSVSFPNQDNVEHDVYSFSPAKHFELKLYSGVPAHPVVFDKPGLVVLGCNIHDAMVAYVLVVDTPYFTRTDRSGHASLDGLPAGEYKVAAWHYRMPASEAVPVQQAQSGTPVPVAFTVPVKAK